MSFGLAPGRDGALGTYGVITTSRRTKSGRKVRVTRTIATHGAGGGSGGGGGTAPSFISGTGFAGVDYDYLRDARLRDSQLAVKRARERQKDDAAAPPLSARSRSRMDASRGHSRAGSSYLGPGSYDIDAGMDLRFRRACSATIARKGNKARRRPKSTPFDPGPGSYNPIYPQDSRPESKMGLYTTERFAVTVDSDEVAAASPAPGTYDVKFRQHTPRVHFGAPSFPTECVTVV